MIVIAEVACVVAGTVLVFLVLSAAVRTVVVPRDEQVLLNRVVFRVVRSCFEVFAKETRPYRDRDRVMARYAPTALMMLPVVWIGGVIVGFSGIFWGLHARPYSHALVLAGSSATTLGFERSDGFTLHLLVIVQATIGLLLVALLVSFLPTMYGHFSRREILVTQIHNWAIDHDGASPATMLIRAHNINGFDRLHTTWVNWEMWFIELEETHTTFPALAFFRSPNPDRSWVTMSGVALDAAALFQSCINTQSDPQASITIRAGYLALRSIATYFGIPFDSAPAPDDPITVSKDEFLAVYEQLASAGVPVRSNREQAWRDFSGWRVNYDQPLTQLASLTAAPWQPWVSDRSTAFRHSPVIRRNITH
jgi:hypothetical protein